MNKNEEYLLRTLKVIFRMINSLDYECKSSIYSLDDDEMDNIFFCRDIAEECIKSCEEYNRTLKSVEKEND